MSDRVIRKGEGVSGRRGEGEKRGWGDFSHSPTLPLSFSQHGKVPLT